MYIIVFFFVFFFLFLSLIINFKLACIKRCIGEHSFSSYFSPTSIIKVCKLNIGVFDSEQTISFFPYFLLQLCIDDSCSLIVVSCYRYLFFLSFFLKCVLCMCARCSFKLVIFSEQCKLKQAAVLPSCVRTS